MDFCCPCNKDGKSGEKTRLETADSDRDMPWISEECCWKPSGMGKREKTTPPFRRRAAGGAGLAQGGG